MYSLLGPKWADATITWSFANPAASTYNRPAITSAFDTALEQQQVAKALDAWSSVSGLTFQHVADATSGNVPEIRIGFADFTNHGEFAGQSGQMLGTAYSSWKGNTFTAGSLVVIQDPTYWAWNTDASGKAIYIGSAVSAQQVLVHEIGHALGLAHSDTPDDLMYDMLSGSNMSFSSDDINGIRALYGAPAVTPPPTVPTTPTHPTDPTTPVVNPPHAPTYGPGGTFPQDLKFSTDGYLAANADVKAAGMDAWTHFANWGWKEGRDPNANFDIKYYLDHNADVAATGMNPFLHYQAFGAAEGRTTAAAIGRVDQDGFDAQYYLLANADVARAGLNAKAHYLKDGIAEGRDGNGYFSTNDYFAKNPDVKAAGMDPLQHYLNFGIQEGRDAGSHADFDGVAYLQANADVAASGINPFMHYLNFGIYEGRDAHADWAL